MSYEAEPLNPRMVEANGVDLCTEAFGDPADPALLLIQGANASMVRWTREFCQQLAGGGRYVVRYDNRDTGGSTAFPPYDPPYTIQDLARDAVGVLDAYGIERAHACGLSLGGMIAQHLALDHASRVLSITVMCSTPDPSAVAAAATDGGAADSALPPPTPAMLEVIQFLPTVDWSDEAAAIEAWVREDRVICGTRYPFDEAESRAGVAREVRRATNIWSHRFNHPRAVDRTPRWRQRLGEVRVPTLVIHGSEDPILPLAHGAAIAREVPGARLLTIDGLGHELPRGAWSTVVPAILAHTNGGAA